MAQKAETLTKVRAAIRRERTTIERAQTRLEANLRRAIELGALGEDVAADAGITLSRVSQLVGGVRRVRAAAGTPAPKRRPTADGPAVGDAPRPPAELSAVADSGPVPTAEDELPDRYRAGALGRVAELLHADGLASDRYARAAEERPTLFVHVDSGEWWSPAGKRGRIEWREGTAAELLPALPAAVERVYVVGPHRPGVTPERARIHGSEADAARAWYLADVPGWLSAGHYLADDAACVGRWATTGPDGKRREVEVQRAAVWFGEGDYGPREAAYAWSVLRQALAEQFPGAILMSTPATTGREAWRRVIPKGDGFPVLSAELRELIASTSGQGRRELVRREPGRIPMVTQWDMRIAYAALTWGMPVGAPARITAKGWEALTDEEQERMMHRRGRWLVRATVPAGWHHVGILPAPADGGRWVWPSRPGTSFTSWCSASELKIARHHGWHVQVIEAMHFAEGKPLNTWKDKLMRIYADESAAPQVRGMLRAAVRNMILATIGAFASRSHVTTRTAPLDRPELLPNNRPIREVGGMYVWDELGERSEWIERASHPEWAAEVWGRCRARLLDAPTADRSRRAGALYVPAGAVIGMRTDGLTLAGDPEWADDGAPGRYRLTGRMVADIAWPQSDAELSAVKRAAERLYETGKGDAA